jgi:uncharacterized protein YbbC (DUF1343 family)
MSKKKPPVPSFAVGIDTLLERPRAWLAGRRVGLLSHQAAVDATGATSAQRLHRELGAKLVALYGPEHGFLGQAGAGEATYTRRHPDWGIPVYSLYGACRKPTPEMLRGVEVVVCDLQDLGARCYTYLATLRNMLEAAAAAGVRVIVADRPIPLPQVVDGPELELAHLSFVGPAQLPMATGLTPAESARWLVQNAAIPVELQVAPMQGWARDGRRGCDWPEFIPPSPGIRTWEAGMSYLATVHAEALPALDCGRGTNLAFRTLGARWLRAEAFCAQMQRCGLAGVQFHPHRYVGGVAPYVGRELDGVRLVVTDPTRFQPVTTAVYMLHTLMRMYGAARVWRHAGVRPAWFDQLYGTCQVRQALLRGVPPAEIVASWQAGQQRYAATRRQALLY